MWHSQRQFLVTFTCAALLIWWLRNERFVQWLCDRVARVLELYQKRDPTRFLYMMRLVKTLDTTLFHTHELSDET